MRKWMVAGVALTLLLASSELAARGRGKGGGHSSAPVSCGSAPAVTYQYVTEYVDVTRQVCEVVPVTTEQEVTVYEVKEKRTPKKETQTWYENVLKT
jgi:type 1 fimbria pilin